MKLGVQIFPTDLAIPLHELAPEVEARGFESLWVAEHTLIPVSRATPYPGGGDLPDEYRRTNDPFVALAAAAVTTDRLLLGTGICLVAQRDHVITAKQVASVDQVSGGRFLFGVGYGWNVEEMAQHGVDPRTRRALVREKVLAMKSLWTDEEASFTGELVRLAPSWMWPKPVQRPHPPVHLGGAAGPALFRHIAEWADGWLPIGGAGVRASMAPLRAAVEEAGRDPTAIEVSIFGARPDPDVLAHHRDIGVTRVVLGLPPAPRDIVLSVLDRYVPLLGAVA